MDTRFQVHALLKEHRVALHYATGSRGRPRRASRSRHLANPMIVVADSGPCRGEVSTAASDRPLGVLRAGAEQGLVDVPALLERLKTTSFYLDETLLNAVFGPGLKP